MKILSTLALIGMATVPFSSGALANTFNFALPTGSTTGGGAVSANAIVTTGAGTVSITLNNTQANITDVAQAISDFIFVLSSGATTGTLSSSSGQQITVNSGGTFSLGATASTGWGINNNVGGGIQLDALGFVGPQGLIIGAPDASSVYSNANGSIANNSAHNPFLNQTATFTVSVAGVTAATNVTSVKFSFGTTAGTEISGCTADTKGCGGGGGGGTPVPEPTSILLLGSALAFGATVIRKRLNS